MYSNFFRWSFKCSGSFELTKTRLVSMSLSYQLAIYLSPLSALIPGGHFMSRALHSRSGPKRSVPRGPNILGHGDIENSRTSVGPVWLWDTLYFGGNQSRVHSESSEWFEYFESIEGPGALAPGCNS